MFLKIIDDTQNKNMESGDGINVFLQMAVVLSLIN